MGQFHTEHLNHDNENDWESLNRESGDGSFYHTLRWKDVLERSFNLKSRYFLVYYGKDPVALCPFFEQPIRGLRSLVPMPSTDFKHLIISDPSNHTVVNQILERSIKIAKEDRCAYIIFVNSSMESINSIRAACPVDGRKTVPFLINGYLILDLEKNDPKFIWNSIFNSKEAQRKYIRRFEQNGFVFRESSSQQDLDIFYSYYSQNLEFIGASPMDRSHFNILFDQYPSELRMTLLEKGNEVAGGMIGLLDLDRKVVHLRYMAINREMANTYHPSIALYWDMVKKAHELGYKKVCFGTNDKDIQDKSYRIKKGFGCEYVDNYAELMPMNSVYALLYKTSRYVEGMKRQD
jgi:CelD/BcsL family acetyltransferase involved in cellulose biosynthesis